MCLNNLLTAIMFRFLKIVILIPMLCLHTILNLFDSGDVQVCDSPEKLVARMPLAEGTDRNELERQISKNPAIWEVVVDFLSSTNWNSLQNGKHLITEDGMVYAFVQEYQTKDDSMMEAHRKYIDIQYVISGREYIYVCPLNECREQTKEYVESSDIEFYKTPSSFRKVLADSSAYIILFPSDAHQPCMSVDGIKSDIRKIVVKIPFIE